jgi:transcriptional regulator with XRE-family HTH domain
MFSENIKLLRKRRKRSQDEAALAVGVKRTTWSAYENGVAEPGFATLIRIADYFKMPVDMLLRQNLSRLSESKLREVEIASETDITGKNLRIVVTTVSDNDQKENIEMVPVKAKAGYTDGYADPDFIRILPTFRLPFLAKERKYRTFPISGDSMPPVNHGAWVTGEYLSDWTTIKDGDACIVVTQEDGIVFKVIFNQIDRNETLLLCSTNPAYDPYELHISKVLEIWKFVNYISPELPTPNITQKQLTDTVLMLQREMKRLNTKVNTPRNSQ